MHVCKEEEKEHGDRWEDKLDYQIPEKVSQCPQLGPEDPYVG